MTSETHGEKYLPTDMFIEHLPIGVAIYDLQEFRLLKANALFLNLLDAFLDSHLHHGLVIGHTITEYATRTQNPELLGIFRSVVETGTPYRGEEIAAATKQGQRTFWNWTLDAIHDGDGQPVALLQTMTEVTSQILLRQQASGLQPLMPFIAGVPAMNDQQPQPQLHAILDLLPEGILVADLITGRINFANLTTAQLLHMPLSQLIGSPIHHFTQYHANGHEVSNTHLPPPWNIFLIRALAGEHIHKKEAVAIDPEGRKVSILVSGAPLYTTQAKEEVIIGAVLVLQDPTIQQSIDRHKNTFLSIASHELRTPITIIQGFAEILSQIGEDAGDQNELMQSALMHIIDQSEHISHLIEGMIDSIKIVQEQFELHLTQQDLLALLTQIVQNQSMIAKQHDFSLTLRGIQEQDTLISLFDQERMAQVISNLINNAVKYSPDGGKIEVGLQMQPAGHPAGKYREVLLWVKDEGIGMYPEESAHAFEHFYRATSLDPSLSGFGIGLFIVKEVVLRHGGRVWIESAKGIGTTVNVSLPIQSSLT